MGENDTKITIIIPAYNRAELLQLVLDNVQDAAECVGVTILIVDDGSSPPLKEVISTDYTFPIKIIYQQNQGLIYAKYCGLTNAETPYILFLDSDDFIHREKLTKQLRAIEQEGADVVYSDSASIRVSPENTLEAPHNERFLKKTDSPAELYLGIQPLPHSPLFRTSYLKKALETPLIPLDPIFNSIGEVWFYYNLSIYPAKISKVDEVLTYNSLHDSERITHYWEKLGASSLALMLAFQKRCPDNNDTLEARTRVGEAAFIAWRKLPRHFHKTIENLHLQVWQESPQKESGRLGGKYFQFLASCFGLIPISRFLRHLQRPHYKEIATMDSETLEGIVKDLKAFMTKVG